jgi:hypothetical protein
LLLLFLLCQEVLLGDSIILGRAKTHQMTRWAAESPICIHEQ